MSNKFEECRDEESMKRCLADINAKQRPIRELLAAAKGAHRELTKAMQYLTELKAKGKDKAKDSKGKSKGGSQHASPAGSLWFEQIPATLENAMVNRSVVDATFDPTLPCLVQLPEDLNTFFGRRTGPAKLGQLHGDVGAGPPAAG